MRPYEVDVPVRVMVWSRPDYLRQQFDVLQKAAPSVLFLVSDGGRNEEEMQRIYESRKIFENIDWECKIHKLYYEENQGMYAIMKLCREYIWSRVDRCIFLEDDYVPAVSFFQYCAELLEKFKDDERIEMITGHNPFGTYSDAEPYDYFFTENGWSIWGTAYWKRSFFHREFPLEYENNEYIKRCLKDNLSEFWYKKAEGYCNRRLVDNHVPGGEYFHAANSALFHRLSIIPTKNLIKNIGVVGEHFKNPKKVPVYMNQNTFELEFPLKHPQYIIDDKHYAQMYSKLLGHNKKHSVWLFLWRVWHFIGLVFTGKAIGAVKNKLHPTIER